MKLLLKIAFGVFFVLSFSSCKQAQQKFKKESRPFIFLENATQLNDSIPWGAFNNTYDIAIGFQYNFLGKQFDSLHLETTGRIVFDADHFYYADGFSEISMQDAGFGIGVSKSAIRYKNEAFDDDQVLIIEFKDASFANDSLSRISFQIRLYKNSGDFELHMGPSSILDFSKAFKNGPFSGVNKVKSFDPTIFDYRIIAHGKPENPELQLVSFETKDPADLKLSEIPVEGTVYRYSTSQ